MNRILFVTALCIAAASAATKVKTAETARGGFGIGVHDQHPQVLDVNHGGQGWGWGGQGGQGGQGGGVSGGWGNEAPALADIVALVLNLLVLAAFGGLVYLLLSPLLSGGHDEGWGRSSSSPYYETMKDNGLLSRVLNSIDYVDTTFAIMQISGPGCRQRAACEIERAAGRNQFFNYATSGFRNRMRSMDLYKDAVTDGSSQKDCVTLYKDCTYTLVDKVGKWVGN